jgi:hypothetical protein
MQKPRPSGRGDSPLLHKDCYDPDLPFRLHEWCMLPSEIAIPKINQYINRLFGKQKKKLDLYYNTLPKP